ncbi:copper resistance protein NlpE N-terminal domain-containing protein [Cardiobacterium valvarum]|uniref:Lipoprotein involved with copper homeostasis and adhesion n=1 Tax=Cardiobacterium valvarum TaxID=194702 RepID=A0A381EEJ8_9GAMM|nr:copper resistance protein NlpE N-terminal domain-containing protein [Cardiobacterium valvarum]SUX25329.1 lipoprotein involved with copper homeostasis and adhesion [Cardiobacterium valvarum]
MTKPILALALFAAAAAHAAEDYAGTYSGILPCAVCEGLQTELTLADGNYTLTRIRLGLDEDSEETSGVYRTTTDKQYLQLDNQTDRLTFYIGNGYLELRQPDGEKIAPELPDEDFRLERQ